MVGVSAEIARAEHARFKKMFQRGVCFACNNKLTSFHPDKPCVHWYLHPVGFTKKHVPSIAEVVGLFQTQMFMRWVANEEAMGRNINDLRDEGAGRLVELTIRHRHCEWSLSCGEGDFQGHQGGSAEASVPHYHLQFRFKKQSFVKFNDYHLPLHQEDIDYITYIKANPEAVVGFAGGQSVGDLFRSVPPDELIRQGRSTHDENEAVLSLNSIVMADPGAMISGDSLADMFERAHALGVPVSSLLSELKGVSTKTIVSPGPGVVAQATRGGRGKRRL